MAGGVAGFLNGFSGGFQTAHQNRLAQAASQDPNTALTDPSSPYYSHSGGFIEGRGPQWLQGLRDGVMGLRGNIRDWTENRLGIQLPGPDILGGPPQDGAAAAPAAPAAPTASSNSTAGSRFGENTPATPAVTGATPAAVGPVAPDGRPMSLAGAGGPGAPAVPTAPDGRPMALAGAGGPRDVPLTGADIPVVYADPGAPAPARGAPPVNTRAGGSSSSSSASSAAPAPAAAGASPMAAFLPILDRTEGGGRYDTLFGHSQRDGNPFAGVDVSAMTVGQAIEFSRPDGEYGQWVNGQIGRVATPMGRHQIVGRTLRGAVEELGIDPNTPFNAQTQDYIAAHLARQAIRSGGIHGLRGTWEGFKHVSDAELQAAADAFMAGENGGALPAPITPGAMPTPGGAPAPAAAAAAPARGARAHRSASAAPANAGDAIEEDIPAPDPMERTRASASARTGTATDGPVAPARGVPGAPAAAAAPAPERIRAARNPRERRAVAVESLAARHPNVPEKLLKAIVASTTRGE